MEAELDKERKAAKAADKACAALDRQLKDMQLKMDETEESATRESRKTATKLEAEVSCIHL